MWFWIGFCILIPATALVFCKWLLPRPRTLEDVLREIVEGLENGTIVFEEQTEDGDE